MAAKLIQVTFQEQQVPTQDGKTETKEVAYAVFTSDANKKFASRQIQSVLSDELKDKMKALLAYED